jgi:hypothetical protein
MTFRFLAGFSNTGAANLNVSGTGAHPVLKGGSAGPVALTGGEMVVGNMISVTWDGANFQLNSVSGILGFRTTTLTQATLVPGNAANATGAFTYPANATVTYFIFNLGGILEVAFGLGTYQNGQTIDLPEVAGWGGATFLASASPCWQEAYPQVTGGDSMIWKTAVDPATRVVTCVTGSFGSAAFATARDFAAVKALFVRTL